MKQSALTLMTVLLLLPALSTAQTPVYDKAKHYQLRSMESGPWEFSPESWYYSWWYKQMKVLGVRWKQKMPGLGVHDKGPAGIGGGDNYVNKYSPNQTRRAIALVTVKRTRAYYDSITASIDKVHRRELLNIADRKFDIVYNDYKAVFNKLNLILNKKLLEYTTTVGMDMTYSAIVLEKNRINEAISATRRGYVTNVDRQQTYIAQIKNLEALIARVHRVIRTHYMFNALEEYKENV